MDELTARLHLETSKLMGVDFLPTSDVEAEQPLPVSALPSVDISATSLEDIQQLHATTCPHCTTVTSHTQIVFGIGNPNASLMFIGDAPGPEEDAEGIPFVGAAGQKLDQIISAMGFSRDDVYITNVVKSHLEDTRTPLPTEVKKCGEFLELQIQVIQPDVIVALGSPATKYLLQTTTGITKLRGVWGEHCSIPVMPTYHPAYLLRNYTKQTREEIWSDMQNVLTKLSTK